MGNIWMACPSKRPPEEADKIFRLWRERGYKLAIMVDHDHAISHYAGIALLGGAKYPGYAVAQNDLIAAILDTESDAEWIVAAADDIEPDAGHSAEQIGLECADHFAGTFGVMQCTGDRWGLGQAGAGPDKCYIDRVAGSPWLGREFCRRAYGGCGPYWPEYTHMGVDEELRAVAVKLGIYWERRDLIHLHQHWGRAREGEHLAPRSRMPDFLAEANSAEHWARYKKLFAEREAANFPGHEVLG